MRITIREFQVAMETYGAERLYNHLSVPCFNVAGICFFHSSSNYIVQGEKKVPKEIMNRAMAEFGEKYPGVKNFWYDKILSIKGILILAAMLDGKYSKELVDELENETYKKLFDCSSIKNNVEFPFHSTHSPKMEELYKLLAEYSNIVNPFGNSEFKLKDPIQYLNVLVLNLEMKEDGDHYTELFLANHSNKARFAKSKNGWYYETVISVQKSRNNGYINIGHYYENGNDNRPIDEVVRLDYNAKTNSYDDYPDNIDLRISLKTGLAWQSDKKEQAKPATDEQIKIMITFLKISIKKIKNKIVRNMINI